MDENEEFMEQANRTPASTPPYDADPPSYSDECVRRIVAVLGGNVQYKDTPLGFFPCCKTAETLPPGIYRAAWTNNEELFFEKQNIPVDDLVVLPDSRSDEVIREIRRFWTLRKIFQQYGFLHKRGFLLWGPPGSGKTCTLMLVTQELVRSGGVVFIANDTPPTAMAQALRTFRQVEPDRPALIVLEDLDAIIAKRGEAEVLSLLDGESSIDNVMYIATTNYPENLDGRVVNRPSRFDRVVKIGMPSAAAREAYLLSRKLDLTAEELIMWVDATDGFSIAHLKEVIVGVKCFGNDFDADIKRLKSMAKTPKSDDPKSPAGFLRE